MNTNYLITVFDDCTSTWANTNQAVHGWSYASLDRYAECVVSAACPADAIKKAIVKAKDPRIVRVIPFDVARGATKLLKKVRG